MRISKGTDKVIECSVIEDTCTVVELNNEFEAALIITDKSFIVSILNNKIYIYDKTDTCLKCIDISYLKGE